MNPNAHTKVTRRLIGQRRNFARLYPAIYCRETYDIMKRGVSLAVLWNFVAEYVAMSAV